MMMNLTCDVIQALQGKTLVTAESCTGGGIGAELTSVPGSSAVYKGGIICYTNWVKENILEIEPTVIKKYGAVSVPVAAAMALNARLLMGADIGISVTGLAGPGGDELVTAPMNDPLQSSSISPATGKRCADTRFTQP